MQHILRIWNCIMNNTSNNFKGYFEINIRKRRPIIDISQNQIGRVRLGLFFLDLSYCCLTWKAVLFL